VLLAQHQVELAPPTLIHLAEPAVAEASRVHLLIFFPQQLQRQMPMLLALLVYRSEVGQSLVGIARPRLAFAEQRLFQPLFVPTLRQRPADSGSLRPLEVLVHSAEAEGTTARNLALSQA
jgi:hypothetical protein